MFEVGQKVECIKQLPPSRLGDAMPDKGRVYTVRELSFCPTHPPEHRIGLRLVEIVNPPRNFCDGRLEAAFSAAIFRPLTSRQTDISIFKKLLNPAPQKVADLCGND